jgi:hypothetical protein
LFLDGILYAQLHSPLGDPYVGYLAYSGDYGATWTMLREESPWTADKANSADRALTGSNFRCMFFINMGKDYELNTDGFVYAFGIGRELGNVMIPILRQFSRHAPDLRFSINVAK